MAVINLIDNTCTHFHTCKSNADHQSQTLRGSNTLSCSMQTQHSMHIVHIIVHLRKICSIQIEHATLSTVSYSVL